MFNYKKKSHKIALFALVVIAIALFYMWWTKNDASKPGDGLTIVTPMPVSGYSVEDINAGEIDSVEPVSVSGVISSSLEPSLEPIDVVTATTMPALDTTETSEEFDSYASAKWKGNIL
jgi:hypothetical protein